jgi:phosphopantetheine adenylyltransferase
MADWPHDPDGEEGSEGMRKYGQAILAKKLDEEEDFPLSKDEFLEAHGDEPVRLNHQRVVSVEEILQHVDDEGFEDIVSFHRTVGQAMRSAGMWEIDVSQHV